MCVNADANVNADDENKAPLVLLLAHNKRGEGAIAILEKILLKKDILLVNIIFEDILLKHGIPDWKIFYWRSHLIGCGNISN